MSKQRLSLSFEQRKCFTPEPFSRKERNSPFPVPSHLSKGSLLLPSYVHHSHLSPYIGPKRNSKFVHPNITSHEAFYEFDYGYKNDLPNPRLLSPVKNDRFHSQERKRGRKPINTELDFSGLSERDEILSQRSHTTERDYFSETPRNKYDYNESVSSRSYMSQSDFNDRELSEFGRPREMLKKHRPQTEKKSRRTPLPSVKEEYEVTEKCYSSHEAHSVDYGHKSRLENGYQSVRQEKLKEQEMERDLLSPEWKNLSFSYDVERQLTVIRAKEAHEAKNQRILEQYRQKYGRPTGPYDGGVIIKALYDRQDEIDKQRKVTRDDLRSHNKKQMGIHKEKKEEERVDRLTSQFTSFQITGNEYYDPYIPSERRFVRDLEEQITDNKIRKMEENEVIILIYCFSL